MREPTLPPNPSAAEFDVVIVGGGMVGMTLAIALSEAGMSVAALDARPAVETIHPDRDGRSSAIAFGSRQLLDGIGAWAAIAKSAQPILDIRVSDAAASGGTSGLFLHYNHRELASGRKGLAPPFGYIVENRVIRAALHARLGELPRVAQIAPARVVRWELATDAGVRVHLEDGRNLAARLLVGADGRDSRVREAAGIRITEWGYPQTAIVCTVAHEHPHLGVAHEHFLPAGPFAMLPLVDENGVHRSSIVWTERKELAPTLLALPDDRFAAEIEHRFGPSLGWIRPVGRRWSYPVGLMLAECYIDRRLALAGDAAHVIHPIAGQGLNLGLRDVAALAEVVVDAGRLGLDIGGALALERYQRWRRFDNVLLAAVTDGLNRLFSNDIGVVRLARDVGLAAVNRMPVLKRLFMRHAMGTLGDLPRLVRGERL